MSSDPGPPTVRFANRDCSVRFSRYPGGATALILDDAKDGSGMAVATANLPSMQPPQGHVFVKSHSENHGMLEALTQAGIVRDTGAVVQAGYASLHVCQLLTDPPWKAQEAAQLEAAVQDLESRFLAQKGRQSPAKAARESQDLDLER